MTALGEAVGSLMSTLFGAIAPAAVLQMEPWISRLLVLGGGAIEGSFLGAAQVVVLGRLYPNLALSKWVLATVAGMTLGWLLGTLVEGVGAAGMTAYGPVEIGLFGAALGLVLGATVGLAQAAILRTQRPARSWIVANALGWGTGLVVTFLSNMTIPAGEWTWLLFVRVALTGAATGATVGAVTGADLVLGREGR